MKRATLVALSLVAAALVLATRVAVPAAPPVYDGIQVAPEPFRYVSPPPDLASTNKPPASGQGDLQVANGANKLATVETDDKQVLAFFPEGALTANTPTITIRITPETNPPLPPASNTLVGNVYRIEEQGTVTPQPALAKPAQVLLRIPPHKLSSIQEFYDNAWHSTQWGAQTDYINLTLDHLGLLAAFDDGQHSQAPPPPSTQFNPIGIIEAGLVVVAIAIVLAGIIVQRRRARQEAAHDEDWGPRKNS
jgi:hypothetical protein